MNRAGLSVACLIVPCCMLWAESRFNRPVMKLAEPKAYRYFKLDDNNFPVLDKARSSVTCMVYRGTKRYYVEVAVVNRSQEPLTLSPTFVTFSKPGYSVFMSDTIASAIDVWSSVAGDFIPTPPPPPTRATTTYSGTAQTYGSMTQMSGTATTTVDNSAAGWHALGQALAARSFYKAESREQSFAMYLASFAHEKQDHVIGPGKVGLFVFTFEQIKPKKAPFSISVAVEGETFVFKYKE